MRAAAGQRNAKENWVALWWSRESWVSERGRGEVISSPTQRPTLFSLLRFVDLTLHFHTFAPTQQCLRDHCSALEQTGPLWLDRSIFMVPILTFLPSAPPPLRCPNKTTCISQRRSSSRSRKYSTMPSTPQSALESWRASSRCTSFAWYPGSGTVPGSHFCTKSHNCSVEIDLLISPGRFAHLAAKKRRRWNLDPRLRVCGWIS